MEMQLSFVVMLVSFNSWNRMTGCAGVASAQVFCGSSVPVLLVSARSTMVLPEVRYSR